MSKRAEQFARKLYTPWSEDGMSRKDNTDVIEACIKGYEQAEKDLALTWEDAKKIDDLFMGVATLFAMVGRNKDILEQPYYEEVAKRFMEQRKK